jgi:hypothetical protein
MPVYMYLPFFLFSLLPSFIFPVFVSCVKVFPLTHSFTWSTSINVSFSRVFLPRIQIPKWRVTCGNKSTSQ